MIIELQRAFSPEEHGHEEECGVCRMYFRPGTILAQAVTDYRMDMEQVCPACIECLGKRNLECFPTIEEYGALLERYPNPIWLSRDDVGRAEEDGTLDAAHEAS